MIRIADAIDTAVDAKDWPAACAFFADTIDVEFTSLVDGEPVTTPADGLIDGWSVNLAGDKQSYHLRGNRSVTFDGPDAATVFSHGYVWNRMQSGAEPTMAATRCGTSGASTNTASPAPKTVGR